MSSPDFNEFVHVRLLGGYFAIEVGEHMRGAFARRHRNHFAAVLAKPQPMRGPRPTVNHRARSREHTSALASAGYSSLADINTPIPRTIRSNKRRVRKKRE